MLRCSTFNGWADGHLDHLCRAFREQAHFGVARDLISFAEDIHDDLVRMTLGRRIGLRHQFLNGRLLACGILRRDRNSTVAPRTRSLHPDGSGRSLPASSFASSSFAFPLRTAFPHVQRTVGSRVRELRKRKGWTQDVFADKSGLNRAHVGEIERGESNVTLQTLKLISDTLKVKIEDLVRGF